MSREIWLLAGIGAHTRRMEIAEAAATANAGRANGAAQEPKSRGRTVIFMPPCGIVLLGRIPGTTQKTRQWSAFCQVEGMCSRWRPRPFASLLSEALGGPSNVSIQ